MLRVHALRQRSRMCVARVRCCTLAYPRRCSRGLPCRDQVQGRMHNIISSLNLVYGLVFSGVAGSALSPLAAADYAEGTSERTLANFCNLAASLQFSIQICGVLFTAFVLVHINTVPDSVIFRCVANCNFTMFYAYLCFYSTFLLLAQLAAIIYMKSDFGWAIATICGVVAIFWLMFWHWIFAMRGAFPSATLHYMPTMGSLSLNPYIVSMLFGSKLAEFKAIATKQGECIIQVCVCVPETEMQRRESARARWGGREGGRRRAGERKEREREKGARARERKEREREKGKRERDRSQSEREKEPEKESKRERTREREGGSESQRRRESQRESQRERERERERMSEREKERKRESKP